MLNTYLKYLVEQKDFLFDKQQEPGKGQIISSKI